MRTWIVRETGCLLLLMALCLTGLGLGDSHLVIFSLYFLIPFFFVINFLSFFSSLVIFLICFVFFGHKAVFFIKYKFFFVFFGEWTFLLMVM